MAQSRLLIGALLALALSYLSLVSYFWNSSIEIPSWVSFGNISNTPAFEMSGARSQYRNASASLTPNTMKRIMAASRLAPLEDEPFTFTALNLVHQSNGEEAEKLLRRAISRNPRSSEARALLIERLLLQGELSEAVEHMEVTSRLLPEHAPQLRDALVYMASVPETQSLVLSSISDRRIKYAVLESLAANGASASILLNAIDDVGETPASLDRDVLANLTRQLIKVDDIEGAYRLWSAVYAEAQEATHLVNDPTFEGELAPPFGWSVNSGQHGFARFDKAGLKGQYYGRRDMVLARQITRWAPGTYRIMIDAVATAPGLQLQLNCVSDALEAKTPIDRSAKTSLNVTIPPSDCAAQSLVISGRASDPPTQIDFHIKSILVEEKSR